MEPISAAIGIGGSLANVLFQSGQNKKNNKFQQQENEKSRAFAREMWDKNNKYNSPEEQMARLKQANINPHLAYQNGSPMNTSNAPAQASGTSSVPNTQAPRLDSSAMAQTVLSAKMMEAQINNINADTANKNANTENTTIIAGMNAKDLENKATLINQENTIRSINITAGLTNIKLTNEQVKSTQQEIINKITQNEQLKSLIELQVSQKNLNEQQKINYIAQLGVIYATQKNLQASTENYKASGNLSHEKAKTEIVSRSNIQADTDNKIQLGKSLLRGNMLGDTYDRSDRENKFQNEASNAKRAYELYELSQKENTYKDLKITEQEYINTQQLFKAGAEGINAFKSIIPTPPKTKGKASK